MAEADDTSLEAQAATATARAAAATPAGLDGARLSLRLAGYCVLCDRIVEREPEGECPNGHSAEFVEGRLVLEDDETVPCLPRFNLAAFAMPPVWGPAHSQWAGAFFLPIWVFVDSAIYAARAGTGATVIAVVIFAATLAFQLHFAKRANGQAWRRVCDHQTVEQFARIQRIWAIACVPLGIFVLAWGTYYRIALS